jgi:glyoxylase-like metal-dependent hydrolase (beta-lactamase superfamily II)
MSSRDSGLDYLAVDPPRGAELRELLPGLHWIRIPLPVHPGHINLWLLEGEHGWVLVDTGMGIDLCRDAWLEHERGEVIGRGSVERIFVTHDHPDHAGLAEWLADRHGARVSMSAQAEKSMREFLAATPEAVSARVRDFLRAQGMELRPPTTDDLRGDHREWFAGMPAVSENPADGSTFAVGPAVFECVETGGHCGGHLCLHEPGLGVLISGDQVLPTISPNVSVRTSAPESNPLSEFFRSMDRLERCAADVLVLPSHGRPFRGLHRRLTNLRAHHEQQLEALLGSCTGPRSAHDLLPTLFGRVPRGFHRLLAVGETLAHLNYLAAQGLLERLQGGDGVVRFARAGS